MSKVIVGFDASEQSDDALASARRSPRSTALSSTSRVVLPRTRIPFEEAIAGGQVSDPAGGAPLRVRRAPVWRESSSSRASLDGELGGRSAARALYEYAADQDADLIVVGSSHRGKLGRILPGSVGESLLRGAPCAVAVAPRGFARREHAGFGLIGIAYDGSEEADLALKVAERLWRAPWMPELRLITVVPTQTPLQMQVALAGELLEDIREEFRRVLERGLSQLGEKTEAEAVFGKATRRPCWLSRASSSTCW